MEKPIKQIEYKGYKINIYPDDNGMNPIQDWDMLGSFACFHRDYDLSSREVQTDMNRENPEYIFSEPEDLTAFINSKDCAIALPLYLYDHSGITIHAGDRPYPYNCQWDSSHIGFVFVSRGKLLKEYDNKKITKAILEKAKRVLLQEVKTFDQYLRGDVYGYMIEKDGEETGGCWGYYGYDFKESGLIKSAEGEIEGIRAELLRKHTGKLKEQIKNHVPVIYREPCPLVS